MPGMNGAGGGGRGGGGGGRGVGGGGGQGMGGGGRGGGGDGCRGKGGSGRGMGGNRGGVNTNPVPNQNIRENNVNKIAISSEGPTLDNKVDPRFGRAGGFVIVDTETMAVEYISNGASQAMAQGAGIQAAETVANTGAQVLLTGYVGPKAFSALSAAGVKIGQDVDGMTVGEALAKYKNGEVVMADNPNRQGGGK